MTDDELVEVLVAAADAVRRALDGLDDWGPAGTRAGQYHSDLAADRVCLAVLDDAGLGWLSEESGVAHPDRPLTVLVDPVDGSTNASRGIPWFATSLCVLDGDGPRVALVVNQATGQRYGAVRGEGAWTVDPAGTRRACRVTASRALGEAIVGLSGWPHRWLGWKQYRALGAVALDLCAVADGVLDAYIDCSPPAHGAWDYAAGTLICREAGGVVVDAFDRELMTVDHAARRTPVAAATPALLAAAVDARRTLHWSDDPSA